MAELIKQTERGPRLTEAGKDFADAAFNEVMDETDGQQIDSDRHYELVFDKFPSELERKNVDEAVTAYYASMITGVE